MVTKTCGAINAEIRRQYCSYTEESISDDKLKPKLMNSASVKNKLATLRQCMRRHKISAKKMDAILRDVAGTMIPPGTKASVRGYALNMCVKKRLTCLLRRKNGLKLQFEQPLDGMREIPDWCITHVKSVKRLIGYNQVDFWGGGAQINRGAKYILDDDFHAKQAAFGNCVVCIVAKKIVLKKNICKVFDIFAEGFAKKRLFYMNGMTAFIKEWIACVESQK